MESSHAFEEFCEHCPDRCLRVTHFPRVYKKYCTKGNNAMCSDLAGRRGGGGGS